MATEVGTAEARRRKLFVLADHIGLTREERMEFARVMLWRDIRSWSDLTGEQVERLLDALEGYVLVTNTLRLRGVPTPSRDRASGPPPDRR